MFQKPKLQKDEYYSINSDEDDDEKSTFIKPKNQLKKEKQKQKQKNSTSTSKKNNAKFDYIFIKRFLKIFFTNMNFFPSLSFLCSFIFICQKKRKKFQRSRKKSDHDSNTSGGSFFQIIILLVLICVSIVRCYIRYQLYIFQANMIIQLAQERYIDTWINVGYNLLCYIIDSIGFEYIINFSRFYYNWIWRKYLTKNLLKGYFQGRMFYEILKMRDEGGREGEIDNPDQRIQSDTDDFCSSLSNVFVNGLVNFIMVIVNTIIVIHDRCYWILIPVYFWPILNTIVYSILFTPISKKIFQKDHVEGDFRFVHARIREHAESMAFFKSETIEKDNCNKYFNRVIKVLKNLSVRYLLLNTYTYFAGYVPMMTYLLEFAVLIYFGVSPFGKTVPIETIIELVTIYYLLAQQTGDYITKIFQMATDMSVVIGNTARISQLFESYKMISELKKDEENNFQYSNNKIELYNVKVKTPTNKVLVQNLNFVVNEGESMLIMGESGCGKSSILRVLAGLWDFEGIITKPFDISRSGIFFLSQKPYIIKGSLKQNVVYPLIVKNITVDDDEIIDALKKANIEYILKRTSLDEENVEWDEILSLGEQQRIVLARMFYVKPKFAVLDESTSALDSLSEAKVYENLQNSNISFISVAHRKCLMKYHDKLLKFNKLVDNIVRDEPAKSNFYITIENIDKKQFDITEFSWETISKYDATKEKDYDKSLEFQLPITKNIEKDDKSSAKSTGLNILLIKRLLKLIFGKFMIGKWYCWVVLMIVIFVGVLSGAIYIPIPIIQPGFTAAVGTRNFKKFFKLIMIFIIIFFAGAIINGLSIFFFQLQGIKFRKNITKYIHNKYFSNRMFYKANVLDKSIDNFDQRICMDTDQLTQGFDTKDTGISNLEFQAISTIVELVGNIIAGISMIGVLSPIFAFSIFTFALIIQVFFLIKISKTRFLQQKKEGYFRFCLTRMKEYSEQIAFYDGVKMERTIIEEKFENALENQRKLFAYTVVNNVYLQFLFDSTLVVSYTYLLLGLKFGLLSWKDKSLDDIVTLIAMNGNFFRVFIQGGISILQLGIIISNLMGYVGRVGEMFERFDHINHQSQEEVDILRFPQKDSVKVKDFTLYTPNRRKLFSKLNLEVNIKEHLLIKGPSGCGKSSLLRVIAGLWDIDEGKIFCPDIIGERGLFFLPQKSYLIHGTLRQQIIYPDQVSKLNDNELDLILKEVNLGYVRDRIGGWDVVKNLSNILSPGEQQRIGVARLIYHKPLFTCLDESTSALDEENEELIYKSCIKNNITFISVGHRDTLTSFHNRLLEFDGRGSWKLMEKKMKIE